MPTLPYHLFQVFTSLAAGGSNPLVGAGQFSPAILVVEGLDLVNDPVTEGSSAKIVLSATGIAGGAADIFQAITYATSQGSFSWRGGLPVFTNETVDLVVEVGEWTAILWGHVEPAYGLSP